MGIGLVAVLWTMKGSNYEGCPYADCWDIERNARDYKGQSPVICHPPCGPWGKLKWSSKESKEDGVLAMEFCHKWGGIVEQPVGSSLFKDYGRGGIILQVNQGNFGHMAIKPTLVYVYIQPKSIPKSY